MTRALGGISAGVFGSLLLMFSAISTLSFIYVGLPAYIAGSPYRVDTTDMWAIAGAFYSILNLFAIICVEATKMLLRRSRLFGAIFISLGVLNMIGGHLGCFRC